ncbi:uncharacterized protein N7446_007830 [Penicillium canescens]|uniref:Uncharacterized protein n=1 Tax=Penicillium canescens TaxID=5083 RepID=A0AAD6NDR8_PENCN|nr:uncharacterized protein N7446_007830 [Penicillium canescens]KAJ6033873.1 hypothetical protein N7444_011644 [Penicillium canescens]KAJ6056937.1 hypothetical protein N7460_000211 [Penicillium canescens]KAJ6058247.1 hypothetical protein N7446_007830 [Penicillium canescens]
MEYFNQIKNRRRSSQMTSAPKPVLSPEDEAYLRGLTAEEETLPIPTEPKEQTPTGAPDGVSPQAATSEDAVNVPLPTSPVEEFGKELGEEERRERKGSQPALMRSDTPKTETTKAPQKKKRWSAMFWKKNTEKKDKDVNESAKAQIETSTPPATSDTSNNGQSAEKDKEAEDMTDILERLNLAADNNRVFSISDETQELLRKFKLIFKDLINGVPTAYHDLEMLLTNGNRQLQDTYTKLPGPMQKLIEKLPERWTETLAPEMLAVAAERAGKSGVSMENVGKAAAAAEKMGINVPSLKELVSKPAALVGMLRSIMAFLRARFPAVMGMNVLWSLALFILLFVLWYCHKRGREVRLENERLVTEEEINKLNEDASAERIRATETLTTTAPQGASSEEIREGVRRVEEARATPSATPTEPENESEEAVRPVPVPNRSKSRLSIFGRSKTEPMPNNVTPYPGT